MATRKTLPVGASTPEEESEGEEKLNIGCCIVMALRRSTMTANEGRWSGE